MISKSTFAVQSAQYVNIRGTKHPTINNGYFVKLKVDCSGNSVCIRKKTNFFRFSVSLGKYDFVTVLRILLHGNIASGKTP